MKMNVDFPEVKRNAAKQGVDLQQITIIYENLTTEEKDVLNSHRLITNQLPGGGCLAKFPEDGDPLFPAKATGVLYLGA